MLLPFTGKDEKFQNSNWIKFFCGDFRWNKLLPTRSFLGSFVLFLVSRWWQIYWLIYIMYAAYVTYSMSSISLQSQYVLNLEISSFSKESLRITWFKDPQDIYELFFVFVKSFFVYTKLSNTKLNIGLWNIRTFNIFKHAFLLWRHTCYLVRTL